MTDRPEYICSCKKKHLFCTLHGLCVLFSLSPLPSLPDAGKTVREPWRSLKGWKMSCEWCKKASCGRPFSTSGVFSRGKPLTVVGTDAASVQNGQCFFCLLFFCSRVSSHPTHASITFACLALLCQRCISNLSAHVEHALLYSLHCIAYSCACTVKSPGFVSFVSLTVEGEFGDCEPRACLESS